MRRRDFIRTASGLFIPAIAQSQILPPILHSVPPFPTGGLLGWWRSDSIAANQGDAIATWVDRSGNGRHLTQPTAGKRPIYWGASPVTGGTPSVYFNGEKTASQNLVIPAEVAFNRNNYTVLLVTTPGQNLVAGVFEFSGGSGNTGLNEQTPSNVGKVVFQVYPNAGNSTVRRAGGCRPHIIVSSGSGMTHYQDGPSWSSAAFSSSACAGGKLGSLNNNTYYYTGAVSEFAVWNHGFSPAELAQLQAYANTRYRAPASYHKQVVFAGDSITAGAFSTGARQYPNQVIPSLGFTRSYGCGYNGITVATMSTNGAAVVDALYDAGLTRNVLVVLGGINDLHGGADATTTYNRIVSYCQARQAAGWAVIVSTLISCNPTYAATATRNAVNASILANWNTFASAVIDYTGDAYVGGDNSYADTTYYATDGIHPVSAGYGVMAGIAAPVAQSLLG